MNRLWSVYRPVTSVTLSLKRALHEYRCINLYKVIKQGHFKALILINTSGTGELRGKLREREVVCICWLTIPASICCVGTLWLHHMKYVCSSADTAKACLTRRTTTREIHTPLYLESSLPFLGLTARPLKHVKMTETAGDVYSIRNARQISSNCKYMLNCGGGFQLDELF